jgi:hypothetical protein
VAGDQIDHGAGRHAAAYEVPEIGVGRSRSSWGGGTRAEQTRAVATRRVGASAIASVRRVPTNA